MHKVIIESPLVSAEWLMQHKNASNVIILDATIPAVTSIAQDEITEQIEGARFADLKHSFSDPKGVFPNTVPTRERFEAMASKLGIGSDSALVIYDDKGIYSSARLWYLFKTFGHEQVAVLDGGLPEWKRNDFPTEQKTNHTFETNKFRATEYSKCIIDFEEISRRLQDQDYLIIDARSKARFTGEIAEPREGLRRGQIPNSINLPYTELLEHGKMKGPDALNEIFQQFQLNGKHLIFSCGSGITACILALAANIIGIDEVCIYDGSWTEYGTLTT